MSNPPGTTAFPACFLKSGKVLPGPPSYVQNTATFLLFNSACFQKLVTGVDTVYHQTGVLTIRSYVVMSEGTFFNAGSWPVSSSLSGIRVRAGLSLGDGLTVSGRKMSAPVFCCSFRAMKSVLPAPE